MNKISQLFKKEMVIRLGSVLIALIMWLIVLNTVNPNSRNELIVTVKEKDRAVLKERGLTIKDDTFRRYINVSVSGRKSDLKNIVDSDFEVVFDFSKIHSDKEGILTIDPPRYIGKEDISNISVDYSPKSVQLDLESITMNPFKVQIITEGNIKEGYKIARTLSDPEIVSVEALGSVLKQIASVKVFVDVTGLSGEKSIKKQCKFYDEKGKEIKAIEKDQMVNVKIEIGRELPVVPIVTGILAKNFIETKRVVVPDKLLIIGDSAILDELTSITTEPLNVNNLNASIIQKKKLVLPKELEIFGGDDMVEVSLSVEPVFERKIKIASSSVVLVNPKSPELYTYEITVPVIEVSLFGSKAILDKIPEDSIQPQIDLAAAIEGKQKLKMILKLPEGVITSGENKVEVKMAKK